MNYWKEWNKRVSKAAEQWFAAINTTEFEADVCGGHDWYPSEGDPEVEEACLNILFDFSYSPAHRHGFEFAEKYGFADIYLEEYEEDKDDNLDGWNFCEAVVERVCTLLGPFAPGVMLYGSFGDDFYGLFISRDKIKEEEDEG